MTDPILDALGRTEELLTAYLRDRDDGILALMSIDVRDLPTVTVAILEFIAAQYKAQMTVRMVAGDSPESKLNQLLTDIHIGFMELRDVREQELRGNATQPTIPEEGP